MLLILLPDIGNIWLLILLPDIGNICASYTFTRHR